MYKDKKRKDKPKQSFQQTVSDLSKQKLRLDRDFWTEYLYWVWWGFVFICPMFFVSHYDGEEGIVSSFEHISPVEWSIAILLVFLWPTIFTGWSYVWMLGQDLLERFRR